MIMSAFFSALSSLLDWVISVRPNWTPTLDPSIATLISQAWALDWLFPIHETAICIGLTGTLLVVMFSVKWLIKLADWVADVIP